jgi:sulfatase maturation enzyme AslB (radical SAM superfamily)
MPLIRLVTNGALLAKPQIADSICEAAEETRLSVRVSLNAGTSKTHEKLHRVKGFFYRVVKGMETIRNGSKAVDLSVSFLLEEDNASEVLQAYEISTGVGASLFWLRPKTGLHGIGLLPLSPRAREAVLEALWEIEARFESGSGPRLHIEPWFLSFLEYGVPPDTSKPYPTCYYCAAARLVITPPEPGIVWSCTYWRADLRFFVADLSKVPFASDKFEQLRIAANRRIVPQRDCRRVICHHPETTPWLNGVGNT